MVNNYRYMTIDHSFSAANFRCLFFFPHFSVFYKQKLFSQVARNEKGRDREGEREGQREKKGLTLTFAYINQKYTKFS